MKPYQPDVLPLIGLDYKRLLPLVGAANGELARYDGLLQGIPNPSIMLSPLTNEESVLSSRIEGTQVTVDEVLEQEAGIIKEGEKAKDIQEVINYRKALLASSTYLVDRPITLFFVRELHKILLGGVRGEDKSPGEFRTEQNWIGKYGCTLEQASFVPPNPLQLMDHLEAWQRYMESDDLDPVLQTAIVHAQFELIHPFKDGNGRIGRLLIPLFLYNKRRLSHPMFYLSSYLEMNREEYYACLQNISKEGDWDGWIAFFLNAVAEQARSNNEKVKRIMALYETMKERLHDITRSQYIVHILDAIFDRPIFVTTDFVDRSGIHKPTAMRFLKQLKDAGVLLELRPGRGRQAAILCFSELLNIAEGKKVFE
ncbi:MAG: Fic family protein [Lentisphaerae bacterium]|nr:Fic family protein [Lentisphaerota bacterium]